MESDKRPDASPATLWSGRLGQGGGSAAMGFTSSLARDVRFWREEIAVAIAHVEMLGRTKLIAASESAGLAAGLRTLRTRYAADGVPTDGGDEDIHSLVERQLGELVGTAAGNLRTARSRNDQVATAFRLYVRTATCDIALACLDLMEILAGRAAELDQAIAPGMTHLQVGQPVLLGHHLLAHAEALRRTCISCTHAYQLADELPLGAGALAGTSHAIDPEYVAARLGFERVCNNSIDAVASRDFVVDFLQLTAQLAVNLSRLAEEIVIWASQPFRAVVLPGAWSTGSSIMPQKKNPDVAELARGRAGAAIGRLTGFLATVKSLPLAYNLDLQEDKAAVYGAQDDSLASLRAMTGLIANLDFDTTRMAQIARMGGSAATDLADYLVERGMPFDQAHGLVAGLVAELERRGGNLGEVSLADLQAHSPSFESDALVRLDPAWSVAARKSPGGTAPEQVRAQIDALQQWIESERQAASTKRPVLDF